MAVRLTITRDAFETLEGAQSFTRSSRGIETVTITGAASTANDTGTYTPATIIAPFNVIGGGPCTFTTSGNTITFTDPVGIGNGVCGAQIIGNSL